MKKILRRCAGCNCQKSRSEMIKITAESSTGKIIVCGDNRVFGRSAYVCYDNNCIDLAFKKNRIFKILKTKPDDSLKKSVKNCTCKHGCATNILEKNLEK